MSFKEYKIYNIGWFWRDHMMDQREARLSPVISERKGVESIAVNALVITYLAVFTLCLWFGQFRMPYIYTGNLDYYWEVIKLNPFSETGVTHIKLLLAEFKGLYIFQWLLFSIVPLISLSIFLIARAKLKKMPMHEASEGGKLSVFGRTLALFIEGKAQMFMLFTVGYSFFATAAFSNWIINFTLGKAKFDLFSLFLPFMALVLVWLFLRPFVAFYIITIHKKN